MLSRKRNIQKLMLPQRREIQISMLPLDMEQLVLLLSSTTKVILQVRHLYGSVDLNAC